MNSKSILIVFAVLVALLPLGCGMPGGGNYPYDVFDRDADTLVKLMVSGGDGALKAGAVSISPELEDLWGKTKTATIVKRVHIAMKAYYWIDVETTGGKKKQILFAYMPNAGRVDVAVEEVK